jgi:hypothetical protein
VMTNVPGPRETLYLAGGPIRSIMYWAPQPGRLGLGVSIISQALERSVAGRRESVPALLKEPPALAPARLKQDGIAFGSPAPLSPPGAQDAQRQPHAERQREDKAHPKQPSAVCIPAGHVIDG